MIARRRFPALCLRFPVLSLALGIAASSPLPAQGPGRQQPRLALKALDLDHDGTLSASEIKTAPSSLLKLDLNGDGILTFDELSERPQNAGASSDELLQQLMSFDKDGKGYLVADDLPERMRGIFTRADANHDGKLTPEEIRTVSAHQGMPTGPATQPGRAGGIFRQDPLLNALDLNHDGILSVDEIAASSTSLLILDTNHDGQITPDEMPLHQQTAEERVAHLLDEWDTNKDGRLSHAEVPDRMAPQFDQLDLNHDGFLDRSELLAYFKAQADPPRREPAHAGEQHPQ